MDAQVFGDIHVISPGNFLSKGSKNMCIWAHMGFKALKMIFFLLFFNCGKYIYNIKIAVHTKIE